MLPQPDNDPGCNSKEGMLHKLPFNWGLGQTPHTPVSVLPPWPQTMKTFLRWGPVLNESYPASGSKGFPERIQFMYLASTSLLCLPENSKMYCWLFPCFWWKVKKWLPLYRRHKLRTHNSSSGCPFPTEKESMKTKQNKDVKTWPLWLPLRWSCEHRTDWVSPRLLSVRLERVYPHRPGWPGTGWVEQTGLKLTESHLSLPLECWN